MACSIRVVSSCTTGWFAGLGSFPNTNFNLRRRDHRMIEPETIRGMTPYGETHRLAPQVKLSRTPGRWRTPLIAVRGGDRPVWTA